MESQSAEKPIQSAAAAPAPVSKSDFVLGDVVLLQFFMLPKHLNNKTAVITGVMRRTVHVVVHPGNGKMTYTHIKKKWCKLLAPSALRSFHDAPEVASSAEAAVSTGDALLGN